MYRYFLIVNLCADFLLNVCRWHAIRYIVYIKIRNFEIVNWYKQAFS